MDFTTSSVTCPALAALLTALACSTARAKVFETKTGAAAMTRLKRNVRYVMSLTEEEMLSIVPALEMEALTGRVFSNVTVFGVEPARVAWGEGLSPAVASALDRLVDAVLDHAKAPGLCRALAGDESP